MLSSNYALQLHQINSSLPVREVLDIMCSILNFTADAHGSIVRANHKPNNLDFSKFIIRLNNSKCLVFLEAS